MQTDNLMSIKIKVHSGYRGSSEEFSGSGGDRLDKISIKSTSTIFYRKELANYGLYLPPVSIDKVLLGHLHAVHLCIIMAAFVQK